jgi:signal transduction histidine kinase
MTSAENHDQEDEPPASHSAAPSGTAILGSPAGRILALGTVATVVLIGLAQFGIGGLGVLWENLHWNVSALTAVAATALSIREVSGRDRAVRLAALGALAIWAVACASFSLHLAVGSIEVPSTLGLIVIAPAAILLMAAIQGRLSRAEEAAVYLDSAIVAAAISAGLFVLFGEMALQVGGLRELLSFLYPLVFFTIAAAGFVGIVAIRSPLDGRGGLPLVVGALTIGVAYLGSVLPIGVGPAGPGTIPGHLFSVGALLVGLGAMTWTDRVVESARYSAVLAFVSGAIGPLAAGLTLLTLLPNPGNDELDYPLDIIVVAAGALFLLRQGLLLRERSLMLTEVRGLHDENDRLVGELRAELGERARVQAHLISASRLAAVGELAAGVAHEVNNPLTGVLGYSEILLEDISADDPRRADVETIRNEAMRARSIIRALHDFARPDQPEPTPTNLADLITRTVDLIRAPLIRAGVIIAESHGELPLIELDPQAIQQVILNVVTNAMQAMPDGGTLRVESARRGNGALVTITDDGVGMDETVAAQAFTPFFSTRRSAGSPGLGLSVSVGLVHSHHGTIQLNSRPGVGTTVEIYLPIAAESTASESDVGTAGGTVALIGDPTAVE